MQTAFFSLIVQIIAKNSLFEMEFTKKSDWYNQGVIIKTPYFGGKLEPPDMFLDDLWWNTAEEINSIFKNRIQVKPNPLVLKAQQIFRDALKK